MICFCSSRPVFVVSVVRHRSVVWLAVLSALCLPWLAAPVPLLAADAGQAPSHDAGESDPDKSSVIKVISGFNDVLIEVMKAGDTLDFQARFERLAPVVEHSFNLPLMTRLAVGRTDWDGFSNTERQDLVDAFARMSVSAYASRFNSYDGQQFSVKDVRDGARKTLIVDDVFTVKQDDKVIFSYSMSKSSDGWRIIDVTVNGQYSELARRRSEFSAVLAREGLAGLLSKIRDITAAYAS